MFIKNEDLILLKSIYKKYEIEQLKELITRLEKDISSNGTVAKEKIAYMRTHGYPYYARSRKVQENHYKRYIKEIKYYINKDEIGVAMSILKRLIHENSYTSKQLEYFMSTIPQEILNVYYEYQKQ